MAPVFVKTSYAHQLAEKLREAIVCGQWQAGSRVPPIRKVAEQYEVSPNTAHAALRELEEAGLLERKQSGGSAYVRAAGFGNSGNPGETASSHSAVAHGAALLDETHPSNVVQQKFLPIAMVGPFRRSERMRSSNDWMGRIFLAAEAELAQSGIYALTRICSMEEKPDRLFDHIEAQIDHLGSDLSGAVLFSFAARQAHRAAMQKLDRLGVPWVSINRPGDDVVHNFVSADNLAAGKTVGCALILEGVKRVLVLASNLSRSVSQTHKVTGLIEAYLHHSQSICGIEYVECGSAADSAGYSATQKYLRNHQLPQAIYTTGDYLAAGAMCACDEAGLNVPDDVSIIGSTGLDMARFTTPALSVIPQPMEAMGQAAGEMLIRMMQTGEMRLAGKQIPGKLILRDSLKISETTRQKLKEEDLIEDNS